MSDQELRQVLSDVMDDIDTGKLVLRRGRRLRRLVAGSALAAGLVLGGCGRPVYGVGPGPDARPDTGATEAYGIPMMDARPDSGDLDAEVTHDASVAEYLDGSISLYSVPPAPEDEDE